MNIKIRMSTTLALSVMFLTACTTTSQTEPASQTSQVPQTSQQSPPADTGAAPKTLPADFPVPIYPNAKIGAVDTLKDPYSDGNIISVLYRADNDVKVVRKWYEAELPKAGWTTRPQQPDSDKGDVLISADKDKLTATIGLYPNYDSEGARYSVILQPKK